MLGNKGKMKFVTLKEMYERKSAMGKRVKTVIFSGKQFLDEWLIKRKTWRNTCGLKEIKGYF